MFKNQGRNLMRPWIVSGTTVMATDPIRRRLSRVIVAMAVALSALATARPVQADDLVLGGMTWMTGFPSTWNAGAPKIVSDGLHLYAVLCGFHGSPNVCSIARKRGHEPWVHNAQVFRLLQPAVVVIDRKGRLNIFFNDPSLRHIRFDYPSVDLLNFVELPGAACTCGLPSRQLRRVDRHDPARGERDDVLDAALQHQDRRRGLDATRGDAGGRTPPAPCTVCRTLYARGRYYVLAGEHPRAASNASYRAAVLFESPNPVGPWTARVLHRAIGNNVGVPYENWVIAADLQADPVGRVRALLHVVETGSGHPGVAEGLHIAREEDGYALRHVGHGIDDAFALQIDPSGVHLAFALIFSDLSSTPRLVTCPSFEATMAASPGLRRGGLSRRAR